MPLHSKTSSVPELSDLGDLFEKVWKKETVDLCQYQTFRETGNEASVKTNLRKCRTYFGNLADQTNATLTNYKLTSFEWCSDGTLDEDDNVLGTESPTEAQIDESTHWVFGYRLGPDAAPYKLTLVCHLDTVPASPSGAWDPFNPDDSQTLNYPGGSETPQQFLIGRGCVDDKGPAASAFIVVRQLAKVFDNSAGFDTTQLEIIFDTSEETDMSTPKFWSDTNVEKPTFGIVYDAMWCVRAEKGGERPVFTVPYEEPEGTGLTVTSLITSPSNSANTIPDWAEAVLTGTSTDIQAFSAEVDSLFSNYVYPDDANYQRGVLQTFSGETDGQDTLKLKIDVAGAQHGSAPEENREEGVNPLISLANFLAGITAAKHDNYSFKTNSVTTMTQFIAWMWGTQVFGEHHEALEAFDEVFTQGNGTTYAVSKLSEVPASEGTGFKLEIDIRYAIDHHSKPWDEKTEGFLEGENSRFVHIFGRLVKKFNRSSSINVIYGGEATLFVPDIRIPEQNDNYQKAVEAFMDVMQTSVPPPELAIGGGTDAKGNTSVLALGPLFSTKMGPPINYHGIMEGAPVVDMKKSTMIMFRLCQLEISNPSAQTMSKKDIHRKKLDIAKMYKRMAKNGKKIACNH